MTAGTLNTDPHVSDAEQDEAAAPAAASADRMRHMLHGPLLPTLIRLALPTALVLFMTTVLAVAETYFVSSLGLDAIAAASLVVPIITLMTFVSSGGIGGGVSSSVARARGAGLDVRAESLAWHALVIGAVAGALFTLVLLLGGPALYSALGGNGVVLHQAVVYSDILFAGAIAFWILVLLQSALRGAGNVKVPALIMLGGVVGGLILSPALIIGWLGLPRMGVAGAGVAQVVCNIGSLIVIVWYMRSPRSNLRLRVYPLQREHFQAILGIGLLSTTNAVMSILAVTALTAACGAFGRAAIAAYGISSRLEMLLVPIMFGFGTAALTVVGTNLGAGNVARARRAAMLNALFVGAVVEVVGLVVAFEPRWWVGLFTSDPEVLALGSRYLMFVGPTYGLIAITSELYFAGQGAGRIGWPMAAGAVRLVMAAIATAWVFNANGTLVMAFGLVSFGAVAAGVVSLVGFARVTWGRPVAR